MAYEMVMPYHLHMPSYFLETFTEYPYSMPYHWIIFFYIFYFLKEFAKVYEFVGSTATLDVAKCKQSLLLY